MANRTIGQLTLASSALGGDYIEFEIAASGLSRRITKDNFIGATLTGGGTLATGGFSLTVPASGTAALLGVVQTFTATKTFFATPINFGGGSGEASVQLDGSVASGRTIGFYTAGSLRWRWDATTQAESGSNAGSNLALLCRDDGGASLGVPIFVERATVNIKLGGTSSVVSGIGAKVHIQQPSTTAAIPVLTLEQNDVSDPILDFVSTIAVGNAIEAVGAKTLTTTHFVKVRLPGSLIRYIPCGTIA